MPVPWKKNLLKIPQTLRQKIAELLEEELVVAAVKRIPEADIRDGIYSHLGIRIAGDELSLENRILPSREAGRWSKTNIDGKEVRRKDLPMVRKTFAVESPNFGDASTYGTHTNYFERDVYQVDLIPPKYLEIEVELINEEREAGGVFYDIKFEVEGVLSKRDADFDENLLYSLNILQENTGVSDIFPSGTSLATYLATVQVDWEIFPPGERDDDLRRILSGVRSQEAQQLVSARYDVLRSLRPLNIIRGTSGFQRYFGAQFSDDLVVFENLRYGNALYVMFENWRQLSQKSRLELLSSNREGFERIVHSQGWETQLRYIVQRHRGDPLDR